MWGASRVRGFADIGDHLDHAAVRLGAHAQFPGFSTRLMCEHRHADVVKGTQPHKFGLAPQELDLALFLERQPVFNFDVLLGWHGHQGDIAVQLGHDPAFYQPIGNAEQVGNLSVVPARMGCPRLRIGVRMIGHDDRVQFAHVGDGEGPLPARESPLDPGDGQSAFVIDPQPRKVVANDSGGAELFVAEFGMGADVFSGGYDDVAAGVDGAAHTLLELFALHMLAPVCHGSSMALASATDWQYRALSFG